MPYIKKESRPPYDALINEIVGKIENATDEQIGIWINTFKTHIIYRPLPAFCPRNEAIDGEFNYFITKLLISLNWVGDALIYYPYFETYKQTSNKIEKLIRECLTIYSLPQSYFNYNRAIGMLTCCKLEFKRRYGNKAILATTFLQMMIKNLYEEIGIYENTKIEINGDV
jgi:hypothetical protein